MTTSCIFVLDHGYVKGVESWGSDARIIEAARMSTQKGFEGWGSDGKCERCGERDVTRRGGRCQGVPGSEHDWRPYQGDEKLLKYLYENQHATPFEMAGATFEVQAPIFVFREWHRHRVPFGYNEMSARYAPLPDLNYLPTLDRVMMGGGHLTKQAGAVKDADELQASVAERLLYEEAELNKAVEDLYRRKLKAGFPKELARTHLSVSRYSRMRATGNLRGWLSFLTLRTHEHAQWEIRQFADAVGVFIAEAFPRTWDLFELERQERAEFKAWKKARKT